MSSPAHLLDYAAMAEALQATGQYRVLRKLQPPTRYEPDDTSGLRRAIFLDVETTGLDAARHEVIELAMAPFTYAPDGRIVEVGAPFQGLREPSHPIPAEITAITGIDDTMVAGQRIDVDEVARFVDGVDLVIAHNAAFDRRFMEMFCETFTHLPWACSMSQVDWQAEGFEGLKLAWLAAGAGFFYDRHRALHDCHAGIELLARALPRSGRRGMAQLLERARAPSWRIWASGAPYDLKDALKARGYRWNGDGAGAQRAWFIDVPDHAREDEFRYLHDEIYGRVIDINCRKIDAYDRFSNRA
ncbi:MAG: polymerase subunit epsilon [Hyphomicrobiales bacterium]|nr:polymerase subunit epsilon [Hyphomicrobiales bacterium]